MVGPSFLILVCYVLGNLGIKVDEQLKGSKSVSMGKKIQSKESR